MLQKLAWFKQGRGTSERRWGDVLGVLRVPLDDAYQRQQWHVGLSVLSQHIVRPPEHPQTP